MRTVTIGKLIHIGTSLRYLQDVTVEFNLSKEDGGVIDNIGQLLAAFDDYSMPVTTRAARPLREFRDRLLGDDSKEHLNESDCDELRSIVGSLRDTLFAEAGGLFTFITSEKRYSTEKLLSSVKSLMAPSVFDAMPYIAQIDFGEAGKCVAFERSTAAAFHVLRGTEDVLRQFYVSIVKRGRVEPLLWGPMVTHLRKRSIGSEALDQLDIIRKNFRNPTQHPDKVYDVEEAQSLFSLCTHAVEQLTQHERYVAPEAPEAD